jgi:putative membrane protein insertion efficiency factor
MDLMFGKRKMSGVAVKVGMLIISVYQVSKSFFLPPSCRFYPTCSTYAADALRKYGPARGFLKALKRICRCHPFHPGGYDPA